MVTINHGPVAIEPIDPREHGPVAIATNNPGSNLTRRAIPTDRSPGSIHSVSNPDSNRCRKLAIEELGKLAIEELSKLVAVELSKLAIDKPADRMLVADKPADRMLVADKPIDRKPAELVQHRLDYLGILESQQSC